MNTIINNNYYTSIITIYTYYKIASCKKKQDQEKITNKKNDKPQRKTLLSLLLWNRPLKINSPTTIRALRRTVKSNKGMTAKDLAASSDINGSKSTVCRILKMI